jgi:hypothetical protein
MKGTPRLIRSRTASETSASSIASSTSCVSTGSASIAKCANTSEPMSSRMSISTVNRPPPFRACATSSMSSGRIPITTCFPA